MEAKDFRQRIIKMGSQVKYLATSTTGTVQDIQVEGENTWIKIDSTGLYYRSDYLLVVEGTVLKKVRKEQKPHEKIKKLKKITPTEISNHGDGPGYGGG
ncbi:MAG: hypothetical protein BME94_00230 [Methanobacteriales archaeon Met13]